MNSETKVAIHIGGVLLSGHLEEALAPESCALFRSLAGDIRNVVHCRWSGESMWMPFEQPRNLLKFENHTSHPHPGQVLIYAAGFSEPEILLPYGSCMFNSKVGVLAGNHFLTLDRESEQYLAELGRRTLWEGAQQISITVS